MTAALLLLSGSLTLWTGVKWLNDPPTCRPYGYVLVVTGVAAFLYGVSHLFT